MIRLRLAAGRCKTTTPAGQTGCECEAGARVVLIGTVTLTGYRSQRDVWPEGARTRDASHDGGIARVAEQPHRIRAAARDQERPHAPGAEVRGSRAGARAGPANPRLTRCYNRGADFLAAAVVFRPDCAAAKSAGVRPQRPPLVHHVGEWLSLVEHLVRDQGVGGSNPLSPTNS